ncbi:MAG: TonB-dependent receptor [Muribaculaceae bacterium]|nr:TonB-dependent receptor [Muribaculaceae bacterium]
MKRISTIILTLLLVSVSAMAQAIQGTVLDATDDSPVVGASVIVAGSSAGTATDADGRFSIEAKVGQTLNVSYIGMRPAKVVINSDNLVIRLEADSKMLDEVVAVGYGVTKKRDLAGSVTSIKAEDVKAGVVMNTAEMMRGRAAGVQVRQTSMEPGGLITVRVRGASSISSNNDPLYVIDGLQTTAGLDINPNDIESIEILKDAAATAIYGARGANGVVIVTTKKGKAGKFTVDYSYDMSAKFLRNPYDLMDAQDIMSTAMKQWEENGASGNAPYTEKQLQYKGAGTDWFKELTRTSTTQTHNVQVAGGSERINVAASLSYASDEGILPNTNFDRMSARLNADFKISDYVRAGANAYIANSKKNYLNMGTTVSTDNTIYAIFNADPLSTSDPDGINVFGEAGRRNGLYSEIMSKDFKNTTDNAYFTIWGEAQILPQLSARVQYSFNNITNKYQKYYSRNTTVGLGKNGDATSEIETTHYKQIDGVLTYHQNFGENHDLKVIAGMSYIDNQYEYNGMEAHEFTTDAFSYYNMGAAAAIDWIGSSRVDKTNISYFGRAEYVLMNKYILNASIRADGASNFGSGHKWGYFPSVSAAWQLGDEKFMDFWRQTVSNFKIRASYGRTGNDGIGSLKSLRTYGFTNVYIGGADIVKGMYPNNAGNADLKWETTSQWDLGFDAILWNGLLEVNFDWYYKKTTDLLNPINISTSTMGLQTTIGNNGTIDNRGWELFIKCTPIAKKNFSWTTTLNLSGNKGKVLDIADPTYLSIMPQGWYNTTEYMKVEKGMPLSSIYGYVFDGVIQEGEVCAAQPGSVPGQPKFKDLDENGIIDTNDRQVIGKGTPDVVLGWGNNFRYRDFDFSFFFDASIGQDMLNLNNVVFEDLGRLRSTMNRWTKSNPSDMPATTWRKDSGNQYGSFVNSRYVEDASFLRLSNIELGYTLPVKNLGMDKVVKGFRVFVGAQRLFTITNYSGFDPEVSTNGASSIGQGLDYCTYPGYRTFNCGAKITF